MNIYLFRHGIAIDRLDPECPADPERFLTDKGKKRTREAARGIAALGIKAEVVMTSPFVRARETAEIAQKTLGIEGELVETDALLWDADPDLLRRELSKMDGVESVLCAGHAPHLDVFIGHMLGTPAFSELKKAGLAVLESGFVEPGDAHLHAIYPPRTLRQLA